jgi:hypothetical protein
MITGCPLPLLTAYNQGIQTLMHAYTGLGLGKHLLLSIAHSGTNWRCANEKIPQVKWGRERKFRIFELFPVKTSIKAARAINITVIFLKLRQIRAPDNVHRRLFSSSNPILCRRFLRFNLMLRGGKSQRTDKLTDFVAVVAMHDVDRLQHGHLQFYQDLHRQCDRDDFGRGYSIRPAYV